MPLVLSEIFGRRSRQAKVQEGAHRAGTCNPMLISTKNRNRWRSIVTWTSLAVLLAVLGDQVVGLRTRPQLLINDFVAFWSAGRLNLSGHDPYSPDRLQPLQKAVGREKTDPERFWNPPWTLPFIMPLAIFDYSMAAKLWFIIHFVVIFFCADCIWRFYGGPPAYRWLAWIVGVCFFPTIYVLKIGQISALVLLGITGFLHFVKRQKGWWAGICILLIAIKPNLLYLFWIALIFWMIERRFWPVMLGMGLAVLAAIIISSAVNPAIMTHYLDSLAQAPNFLSQWATPTFGSLLRILLGVEKTWFHFIPPMMGTIWFLLYWLKHHRTWEWGERMPMLLLVSLATATYSWGYDQVVLQIAVVQVGVGIFRRPLDWMTFSAATSYLGMNFLSLIMPTEDAFSFIWTAPSLLLWYWSVQKRLRPEH